MKVLITGGAGFIGCNWAARLMRGGHDVTIYDNLSRKGAHANLDWLRAQGELNFIQGDVREAEKLIKAAKGHNAIYHLAAQVAVTTSVVNPREDFEINALGTFNMLEAARLSELNPVVVYASTNKVYGGMEEVRVSEAATRYGYTDLPWGLPESQPLDFHSPYGCSKGSGDQYVRDYARIYGLNSVVFRQSCLAATQEVITPFGRKPVASLKPGDLVHSGHGWTKVCRVWSTGTKLVRRLRTIHGLSVDLTADHRVLRPHGLFSNRDFAYGDFLAVLPEALHAPIWEATPDRVLDSEDYLLAVQARTTDVRCINDAQKIAACLLPLTGDKLIAIAEIVGRLFGDGHLGIHTRQTREASSYTVQHFGYKEELQEVSERLVWLGLPTSKITCWSVTSQLPNGHVIEGQSCRIQQQSIPVFTLFEMLGVPVGDKTRVEYQLPEWVIKGHKLVRRAFLRGFFGAELGKPNVSSSLAPSFAQSKDVDFQANGRQWIQQLRDLIAGFGIETSCFESGPTDYKRGTTTQTTVRLLGGKEMYGKLASLGYGFNFKRSLELNALLRWQWEQTPANRFESIKDLYRADGQLFWDSLATTEPLGEQAVYDIEVEAETHLLVAGGIQVSNCVYGLRQFGVEDQGWLAHFVIATVKGRPINIYGDGKQVRDMLWVEDLLAAYEIALNNPDKIAGKIYNIGGGPEFTLSIWAEVGPLLAALAGREIEIRRGDWRPGDQQVYVSDIRKAEAELGWKPKVSPQAGLKRLWDWVKANDGLFE